MSVGQNFKDKLSSVEAHHLLTSVDQHNRRTVTADGKSAADQARGALPSGLHCQSPEQTGGNSSTSYTQD